jgi:hypothetical protein
MSAPARGLFEILAPQRKAIARPRNASREGPRHAHAARLLAARGRHGDTLLAHITPLEAVILQLLGGSGTINPKTGLPEFWGLGGGVASGGHGDAGDGTGGASRGNGDGGKGSRNDSKQGTAAKNAQQAHLGAGYGSGSQTGISQGDIDKMVTGPSYRTAGGPTVKRGVTGDASLGHTPDQRGFRDVLGDILGGAWRGSQIGGTIGSFGGPAGSLIGTGGGAIVGGIHGAINGSDPAGVTRGQNVGAPEKGANGSDTGSNQGGLGANGGRGDSGGLPIPHTAIAQNAQQANAGGGLLAVLNPAAPTTVSTTPTLPVGLLQYLAQNPGLLQGFTANTRFGPGTVAPVHYGQPFA